MPKTNTKQQPIVMVSVKTLAARASVSEMTIWRWAKAGKMPKPIKLSSGCTRWKLSEIEAWEASKSKQA